MNVLRRKCIEAITKHNKLQLELKLLTRTHVELRRGLLNLRCNARVAEFGTLS